MIPANEGASVGLPPASIATNGALALSFDSKGYDQANITIDVATCGTDSVAFSTLRITESDTVTVASSMSGIVALTGGTATSTSAGFVVPTPATMENGGRAIEFQIDLRKRKRYIGLYATNTEQALVMAAHARLTRSEKSADSATERAVTNMENTDAVSVSQIVTA